MSRSSQDPPEIRAVFVTVAEQEHFALALLCLKNVFGDTHVCCALTC